MLPVTGMGDSLAKENGISGKTCERLLEIAGEVFAEQGLHGATVREITSRAGVNIAAVNYYFRDKEELYAAVLRCAHQSSLKDVWQEKLAGENAEDRLRRFVYKLLHHLLDPSRPTWHGMLMARELAKPTSILHKLVDEGLRPRCQLIIDTVQELAGTSVPQKKLRMIAASILGQCFFYRHSRAVAEHLFPELYVGENWLSGLSEHISNLTICAIRAEFGKNP